MMKLYYLYCVTNDEEQSKNLYKIGFCSCVESSLKSRYNTYFPNGVNIIKYIQVWSGTDAEKLLKFLLTPYKHRREWYNLTPSLIDSCFDYIHRLYPSVDTWIKHKTPKELSEFNKNMRESRFNPYDRKKKHKLR